MPEGCPKGLAITPTRITQPLEPPRAPWDARGAACRPGQTSRLIGCGMLPPSSRPASGRPLIPPDEARGLCIAQAQTQTWRDWHKPSLAMRLLRRFGCRQTALANQPPLARQEKRSQSAGSYTAFATGIRCRYDVDRDGSAAVRVQAAAQAACCEGPDCGELTRITNEELIARVVFGR